MGPLDIESSLIDIVRRYDHENNSTADISMFSPSLHSPPLQLLLPLIRKQQPPIPPVHSINHRIPLMKPPRMFIRAKPSKPAIKIITQQITASKHQKGQDSGKINSFRAVIVVHDEEVDETPHCAAHAERTEDERPEKLREQVAETCEKETGEEEDGFRDERVGVEENEGAEVEVAAFGGVGGVGRVIRTW